MKFPKRKEFERVYSITNLPLIKRLFKKTRVVIRFKQASLYETEEHFAKTGWDLRKIYDWTAEFVKEHIIEWWISNDVLLHATPRIFEDLKNTYLIGCYITKEEYDKQYRIQQFMKAQQDWQTYENYKNNAVIEAANAVAVAKSLNVDPMYVMENYTIEMIAYVAHWQTFLNNAGSKDWDKKNISWLNKREHEYRTAEQIAEEQAILDKLDKQRVDFTSIQGWEQWQSKE